MGLVCTQTTARLFGVFTACSGANARCSCLCCFTLLCCASYMAYACSLQQYTNEYHYAVVIRWKIEPSSTLYPWFAMRKSAHLSNRTQPSQKYISPHRAWTIWYSGIKALSLNFRFSRRYLLCGYVWKTIVNACIIIHTLWHSVLLSGARKAIIGEGVYNTLRAFVFWSIQPLGVASAPLLLLLIVWQWKITSICQSHK